MHDFVELFAGPGGASLAAERLGLTGIGIEKDPEACETRRAAGFPTIVGDVRDQLANYGWNSRGLIASPPCQTFSSAGSGSGRAEMAKVIAAIENWTHVGEFTDPRTALVLEPLRWILFRASAEKHFEWIALEQVPQCLPICEAYARLLHEIGYFVVTGVLHAEMYGVPQTRKRAVLIAHRHHPVSLPTPTHSRYYQNTPWRLDENVHPWVSMAEALGWDPEFEVVSNYEDGSDEAWKARFKKFVHETPTCWEWTGALDTHGYGIFQLNGRATKAHRLALLGPDCREVEELVRHSCDNRRCVRPGHLLLGTPALNSGDMVTRGRSLSGESNPAAVLTGEQVVEIRSSAALGETGTSLARRFGVGSSTIYRVIKGTHWTAPSKRGVRTGDQPAATVTSKIDRNRIRWLRSNYSAGSSHTGTAAERGRAYRSVEQPSFTIGGRGGDCWTETTEPDAPRDRMTVAEAGVLQSFPADFPWRGADRYQQVGNAYPPLLAEAVLRAVHHY